MLHLRRLLWAALVEARGVTFVAALNDYTYGCTRGPDIARHMNVRESTTSLYFVESFGSLGLNPNVSVCVTSTA